VRRVATGKIRQDDSRSYQTTGHAGSFIRKLHSNIPLFQGRFRKHGSDRIIPLPLTSPLRRAFEISFLISVFSLLFFFSATQLVPSPSPFCS